MKASVSLAVVVLSSLSFVLASPVSPQPPTIIIRHKKPGPPAPAPPPPPPPPAPLKEEEVGVRVAAVGNCPADCWNEAAVVAGCDPNVDDDCLCGPFFDAVTLCTSQTCSIADNLAALDFLEPACN